MKSKRVFFWIFALAVASFSIARVTLYKSQSKSAQPKTQVAATLSVKAAENLFGNSSCTWPCWQGIIPGSTTRDEALQLLNNSPLIVENTISSNELATGFSNINWYWRLDGRPLNNTGLVRSHNEIVYQVQLETYHNVSIEEVINRFGPPEKVDLTDCTEIPEGEFRDWCGILFYTKKGFYIHVAWAELWGQQHMEITPSDPIKFITLIKPSTIEEWTALNGLDSSSFYLQDWKGYGNLYDLYMR